MNKKWQRIRLKFFSPSARNILSYRPEGMRYIGLENIESKTGKLLLDNEQVQVDSAVVFFDDHSVLFGKLRPYLAKVATPDFCGVASTEIMVFEPIDNNNRQFLAYLLLSDGFIKRVSGMTDGAKMPRANPNDVLNLSLFVPEPTEQRRIAAYLDEQTAKIDRLMDLRRQQMALLKEQRAALIQQAVTRGLNPNVPMKDSGLPWLGEIPRHWEVKRLKFITPQVTVGIVINPSSHYVESGIPCLRSLNIKAGALVKDELVFINQKSHQLLEKSAIYRGDIVAVRTGQPGTTAVVDEYFHNANCIDLIIVRSSSLFVSEYIQFLLNSNFAKAQFDSDSDGAIQQHFNIQTAKNLFTLLPPLSEQWMILDFIEGETIKFSKLHSAYSRQLTLLTEYRAALIHECVTGQRAVPDNFNPGASEHD